MTDDKYLEFAKAITHLHELGQNENMLAAIGRMRLIVETAPVAEVPCSVGLFCRVRSEGETMRSGDIVLISDTFRPLGFHTEFYHYFVGLKVVEGMTGKIICKAT